MNESFKLVNFATYGTEAGIVIQALPENFGRNPNQEQHNREWSEL
jgi:hypothetical protein